MKPTKEQLADPKWWDENANGYDYVYETGPEWDRDEQCKLNVEFADADGVISEEEALFLSEDSWVLLSKRPESKWVPEVGDWCEAAIDVGELNFNKIKINYISDGVCAYELNNKECVKNTASFIFRPLKTQREELVDIMTNACSIVRSSESAFSSAADSILAKYELTEKDGE